MVREKDENFRSKAFGCELNWYAANGIEDEGVVVEILFKKIEVPPSMKSRRILKSYQKDGKIPNFNFKVICLDPYEKMVDCEICEVKTTKNYAKMIKYHNKLEIPIWIEVYEEDRNN